MRKFFPFFISLIILVSSPTFSQSQQTITLKDGTVLKGKVASLTDGIYTIETENLGQINVSDQDILTISAESSSGSSEAVTESETLRNQVQSMQNVVTSDPDMMRDIQNVMQNEEVMNILQSDSLLEDVLSMDPQRIENNSGVQKLMSNPEMKQLMDKIKMKVEGQVSPE